MGIYGQDAVYACASSCTEDPACAVWTVTQDHVCWHGSMGSSCHSRDNEVEPSPLAGQRMQHGNVRVLRTLLSMQVYGLQHEQTVESWTTEESIAHCQRLCYSSIDCHYWQYGP